VADLPPVGPVGCGCHGKHHWKTTWGSIDPSVLVLIFPISEKKLSIALSNLHVLKDFPWTRLISRGYSNYSSQNVQNIQEQNSVQKLNKG
jgi:hypothetical protein